MSSGSLQYEEDNKKDVKEVTSWKVLSPGAFQVRSYFLTCLRMTFHTLSKAMFKSQKPAN